jgi:hypothetical protein
MFALIGRVRRLRDIAVNWRQSFVNVLTDSCRPEMHYMRGDLAISEPAGTSLAAGQVNSSRSRKARRWHPGA